VVVAVTQHGSTNRITFTATAMYIQRGPEKWHPFGTGSYRSGKTGKSQGNFSGQGQVRGRYIL